MPVSRSPVRRSSSSGRGRVRSRGEGRNTVRRAAWVAIGVALAGASATAPPAGPSDDEAKVPAYTLPDPLRFVDGSPVRDASAWTTRRRAEVLRLFEENVYGRSPGPPPKMRFVVEESDPH